jgi:hypothetical protein
VSTRRPSIQSWLAPTFLAPLASAFALVTAYAWLGPVDGVVRWIAWIVGLLAASLWVLPFALIGSLLDVLLLKVKVRMLPSGARAWALNAGAAAASLVSYAVVSPHRWWKLGPWAIVAALLLPPIVALVVSRLAFGQKIEKAER